jgi:hypothetical protein
MTGKETGVRMVSLRTHKRPDGMLVRRGDEFQATEEEAKQYAVRESPLAGPLEDDDEQDGESRVRRPAKKAATPRKKAR